MAVILSGKKNSFFITKYKNYRILLRNEFINFFQKHSHSYMNRCWLVIFILLSALSSHGQEWLKKSIPSDLDKTCLIVEKIDSMGMKCVNGKKPIYCSDFEKSIDKQLASLQKIQESAFQNYHFPYIVVLPKAFPYQEYADLKDVNKYRYILRIHFFQPSDSKNSNSVWFYYFYDRKTQKAFPRIHQIQDFRFKYLKEFITQLNTKFEIDKK